MKRIAVVAGDAGGAAALVPVITELLKTNELTVALKPYGLAESIWSDAGLNMFVNQDSEYDLLLTGTSVNSEMRELDCIKNAHAAGKYSVSLIDFWSNIRERFIGKDGSMVLPDALAVLDEGQRKHMVGLGFPDERLFVTGHPLLEDAELFGKDNKADSLRSKLITQYGLTSSGILVLFASQPIRKMGYAEKYGFDEVAACEDVCAAAKSYGKLEILLLPHPRETSKEVKNKYAHLAGPHFRILKSDLPWESVLSADIVIGMNSMLLMEACLMRKTVISHQPNLKGQDYLVSNASGWSVSTKSRSELQSALESFLTNNTFQNAHKKVLNSIEIQAGAANRVVSLVLDTNAR